VKERLKCVYCDGSGEIMCGHCLGTGMVSYMDAEGTLRLGERCENCEGTGTVVCINCQGSGLSVPEDFLQILGDQEVRRRAAAPRAAVRPDRACVWAVGAHFSRAGALCGGGGVHFASTHCTVYTRALGRWASRSRTTSACLTRRPSLDEHRRWFRRLCPPLRRRRRRRLELRPRPRTSRANPATTLVGWADVGERMWAGGHRGRLVVGEAVGALVIAWSCTVHTARDMGPMRTTHI
jgi:hypothetical protein